MVSCTVVVKFSYPETVKIFRNRRGRNFSPLKFNNLDTWSIFSRIIFLAGVYFRGIKSSRIDGNSSIFAKIRSREHLMPDGKYDLLYSPCH